jgi:DDE family transposase
MDGELWYGCYRLLRQVQGRCPVTRGVRYGDARIVEVFLWAVMHDRPVSWACHRSHWPPHRRGRPLPSAATMSRRLRTYPVIWMLTLMQAVLRKDGEGRWGQVLDGLPLPVGGCSKDPDAKAGKSSCGIARGYKIVALTAGDTALNWRLGPMNLSEPKVAERVLADAVAIGASGYVLGDKAFDINNLHACAAAHGFVLRTPRRQPGKALGHRRHHPARVQAIHKLETREPFTRHLLSKHRTDVERSFAHWGVFVGGLGPLPRFVRRPRRVALWVAAKLILHGVHARQRRRKVA